MQWSRDPTVLVRGLTRITHKVLQMNPELRFRVSLARTTLLIDSAPDKDSVTKFATHLLAEVESVAYMERKTPNVPTKPNDAATKLKKISEGENGGRQGQDGSEQIQGQAGGRDWSQGRSSETLQALPDGGRAQARKSMHLATRVLMDRRDAYNCGSTKHFAQDCPYSRPESQGP